jgi:hypothetical protein
MSTSLHIDVYTELKNTKIHYIISLQRCCRQVPAIPHVSQTLSLRDKKSLLSKKKLFCLRAVAGAKVIELTAMVEMVGAASGGARLEAVAILVPHVAGGVLVALFEVDLAVILSGKDVEEDRCGQCQTQDSINLLYHVISLSSKHTVHM